MLSGIKSTDHQLTSHPPSLSHALSPIYFPRFIQTAPLPCHCLSLSHNSPRGCQKKRSVLLDGPSLVVPYFIYPLWCRWNFFSLKLSPRLNTSKLSSCSHQDPRGSHHLVHVSQRRACEASGLAQLLLQTRPPSSTHPPPQRPTLTPGHTTPSPTGSPGWGSRGGLHAFSSL